MKNTIVIGGGASGMMAAIAAAENTDVTLLEKNEKLGKKLYITGKGRCNLTNAADVQTLIENTCGNPYFMYSAFYKLDSEKTMEFFEELGVPLKVERGGRVFPVSEKASDIIKAMERKLIKSGVKISLNTEVMELILEEGTVKGVVLSNGAKIYGDSVIVATGGLSYPVTGSTGDGYKMARSSGHKVTKLYPSLVPLKTNEDWVSELQGLSLKNISITVRDSGKIIYKDFGEMLFTHFGVSGPVILSAGRYITDKPKENITLIIDLKPALADAALDNRLLRDFDTYKNKDFKYALDDLLPKKLIPIIIKLSNIDADKKTNLVTKEERKRLLTILKNLTMSIKDTAGYNEAVITMGGVCTDEIDPATMESKRVKGLYFSGEVIDVDAFTGGFNLQIAFSTGFLAGASCGIKL